MPETPIPERIDGTNLSVEKSSPSLAPISTDLTPGRILLIVASIGGIAVIGFIGFRWQRPALPEAPNPATASIQIGMKSGVVTAPEAVPPSMGVVNRRVIHDVLSVIVP